jgi:hypothetical protein
MRALKQSEFITKDNRITPKGVAVLGMLTDCFTVPKNTKKSSVSFGDNIDKYLSLFPKIELPSGKPARSAKGNIEQNFKWFFAHYSYSWDTILRATSMYLDEYEAKSWQYMRTSQYFIRKSEPDKTVISELANYCDLVESGVDTVMNKTFKDKVV